MPIPANFYLITYMDVLVWNRKLLAFVPTTEFQGKTTSVEDLRKYWFIDLEEAKAQAEELNTLGVGVTVNLYTMGDGK